MKRPAPCLAAVILFTLIVAVPFIARAEPIDAYLDAACTTINGAFTVPEGMAAVDFTATMSSPWRACSVDYPIDTIGFMIVDSTDKRYYVYAQYKNGSSNEFDGPLSGLSLGPGAYTVYVQGGLDTRARVSYRLVTKKVLITP